MSSYVGTSGYHYEWWMSKHGVINFYTTKNWLSEYSQHFNSVEICTEYQKLTPKVCGKWLPQVPSTFKFTIKTGTYITHKKKMKDFEKWWDDFEKCLIALGENCGAILFQFHTKFQCCDKNIQKLEKVKEVIPEKYHVAFEFRHTSWFNDTTLTQHLFTGSWMQAILFVPECRDETMNFGNLCGGIHIGAINEKYGYVRVHGSTSYSSGTHTNDTIDMLSNTIKNCDFSYGYFNNVDTWTALGMTGGYNSVPDKIPIQPSAVYNALQMHNILNNAEDVEDILFPIEILFGEIERVIKPPPLDIELEHLKGVIQTSPANIPGVRNTSNMMVKLFHTIKWEWMKWGRKQIEFKRQTCRMNMDEVNQHTILNKLVRDCMSCDPRFDGRRVEGIFCNYYEDGSNYTPYHQDSYGGNVLTVSFGGSRDLLVKPIEGGKSDKYTCEDGDIVVFSEQWDFKNKHSIPKRSKGEPRISIVLFFE